MSKEFNIFLDYIKNNPDISSYIFPKNVIKALVDVINIIYKNNLDEIYVDSSDNLSKKLFLNIINKHNTSIDNFKDSNSLKNSVVSKTLEIISTPSNQVLANTPVDVKDLKDAVKIAQGKVKDNQTKENKATYINIKGTPSNQEFQIKKDLEDGFYSVHFKTEQGKLTKDQIQTLVDAIASQIPIGGKLST